MEEVVWSLGSKRLFLTSNYGPTVSGALKESNGRLLMVHVAVDNTIGSGT